MKFNLTSKVMVIRKQVTNVTHDFFSFTGELIMCHPKSLNARELKGQSDGDRPE